jgi:predicted metalloprotease with PDZ domain
MLGRGLLAAIIAPIVVSASSPPQAEFTMQPIMAVNGKDFEGVAFTFTFPGEVDGTTKISLPDEWAGESKLYEYLFNFRGDNATVEAGESKSELLVKHAPGATITLRYQLNRIQRFSFASGGGNDYRPIITPQFFHLIGHTFVVRPDTVKSDTLVIFRKGSFPNNVSFASDLEHQNTTPLTLDSLSESINVGGDFRVLDGGNGLRIAIRGALAGRDDRGWINVMQSVSSAQNAYWKSPSQPYLITAIIFDPENQQSRQSGGTGLGDSFAFMATSNIKAEETNYVLSHEYAHSWIPRKIGGFDLTDGFLSSLEYWLSEGFTDFVTLRVMARSGLLTPQTFADQFNQQLRQYDESAYKEKPNAETAKLFWSDRDAGQLPYYRGMLFATWIDYEIIKKTKGRKDFDDLLFEMQRLSGTAKATVLFRNTLKKFGMNADQLISNYIDQGKAVPVSDDIFAPCGTITTSSERVFDAGFNFKELKEPGTPVTGVVENKAAWTAGLRNGIKLFGWSVYDGDTTREIVVQANIEGKIKEFKWMPVSEKPIRRLTLAKNITELQKKACMARLSGLAGNTS